VTWAFSLGQNLFSQPLRALGGVLITSENLQMGISQQISVVILGANLANLQGFFHVSAIKFLAASFQKIPSN
jgi:hypothetical protein